MTQILSLLSRLTDIYTGNYHPQDDTIRQLKQEMMDISRIPTPADDRKALNGDMRQILKDTKKAFKDIKTELTNG